MSIAISRSRREMLRQSAGSLLTLGLWPGALCAHGEKDSGEFHFLVVNDTHYRDKRCGAWMERVIGQMKKHDEKIDFCLLAGDLATDGKPGELGPLKDLLKKLGVPVHVVVGNHDYLSKTDRKPYEQLFPDQINYQFEHAGWNFIGLDSSDGLKYQNTKIRPETLRWLDDKLPKLDKKRPTVLFTHFPMGPKVKMRPTNAEDLLKRFEEHNLQAVFCGHYHAFTERKAGATIMTTNRCCAFSRGNHDGSKEKGYFLCSASAGKITRRFIEVKPA